MYQEELICVCDTQQEVLNVLWEKVVPAVPTYVNLLRFWPGQLILPRKEEIRPLIFTEEFARKGDKIREPDLIERPRASVPGAPGPDQGDPRRTTINETIDFASGDDAHAHLGRLLHLKGQPRQGQQHLGNQRGIYR